MSYRIIRMPKDDDSVKVELEKYIDFLAAMYPKEDEDIHGELNFAMDYFLYLWDNGGLVLLEKTVDDETVLLALCTQYKDMWCGKQRVEIQRLALKAGYDEKQEIDDLVKYLKNVSSLMGFQQLYFHEYYSNGDVMRKLLWSDT